MIIMTKTMNISVPKNLADQVQFQVKLGEYVSVSEFIREAIRDLLRKKQGFASEAEKEILKISQSPTKPDYKFDSKKTNANQMLKSIS